MFCPNCGGANPDGASFCQHCGYKMEQVEEKVIKKQEPERKRADGESGRKGIILLVIIVAFIAAFFLGKKNGETYNADTLVDAEYQEWNETL